MTSQSEVGSLTQLLVKHAQGGVPKSRSDRLSVAGAELYRPAGFRARAGAIRWLPATAAQHWLRDDAFTKDRRRWFGFYLCKRCLGYLRIAESSFVTWGSRSAPRSRRRRKQPCVPSVARSSGASSRRENWKAATSSGWTNGQSQSVAVTARMTPASRSCARCSGIASMN